MISKPPESGDLYDVITECGVTSKAETEGQTRMCFYATLHKVITSYRLPDK